MFNYILSQEKTKSQNMNVLKETGIIEEYSYLLNEKASKGVKYVSKNYKTLKNYLTHKKHILSNGCVLFLTSKNNIINALKIMTKKFSN